MRFLFIESTAVDETQLSALDTRDILLRDCPNPDLMDILDFMERNPDFSLNDRVSFWEFVTTEVAPPEPGILEDARRKDHGARYLEVYALDDHEPVWDRVRCANQNLLNQAKKDLPLYALVPLRRGRPDLRVING